MDCRTYPTFSITIHIHTTEMHEATVRGGLWGDTLLFPRNAVCCDRYRRLPGVALRMPIHATRMMGRKNTHSLSAAIPVFVK